MTEENMNEVIAHVGAINPSHFISIRGYQNSAGEVANFIFQSGIDYDKLKRKDLAVLKAAKFDDPEYDRARLELIAGIENTLGRTTSNPVYKRVQGNKNIKRHSKDGSIHIIAHRVMSREEVTAGQDKRRNVKTRASLIKTEIQKQLNLNQIKVRQFKLNPRKISRIEIPERRSMGKTFKGNTLNFFYD